MMNPQNAMVGMQGGAVGAPMANIANAGAGGQEMLNTYIYDHLCKMKLWDLARSFYQSCPIRIDKTKKEVNGDDGMDADSKDGIPRPEDLPIPSIGEHASENSFLFDWWSQFWDLYGAARKNGNEISRQYYAHNMQQSRLRNASQQNMMGMGATNMMARQQQFAAGMQANGMNNMQKQAIANRNGMNQMMANKMQQNSIQEGDRPQSPGSMGNAPSPSKRPRLDDGQFNGQPNPAGRGQPMPGNQVGQMPGAPNGMMMQNGMPADMNQLNFAQNGQQKMEMAGVAPQGMDGSFDMMNQQRPMANGAANPSQGNHALQDYQMQLMLLEQQNKKRLLMARQEQDNISHVPGSSQPPQIQFAGQPAGMSPQNGRPGPSPNPNDQMKRMQTPKMGPGNMPGSPAMNDGNRGSPMPGNFDQNNIPPQMRQQMFAQQGMMGQGQPPSSHPNFQTMQMGNVPPNMNMEQQMRMAAQAQGRMPNGAPFPQGAPAMMQNPGQQGMVGTQQQRPNAMPPPPAPNTEQQRTQPSSPAQGANGPPTPSQAPKAAPKGKKETAKKTAPQKGAAAKKDAATPSANADNAAAATPQPSTPITPMHPASFGNQKPGANATAGGPAAQPQPPQPQAPNAGMPDVGDFGFGDPNDLGFATEGPDVLESFDFDSFLNNTDDANGFGNLDFNLMGFEETTTT